MKDKIKGVVVFAAWLGIPYLIFFFSYYFNFSVPTKNSSLFFTKDIIVDLGLLLIVILVIFTLNIFLKKSK